MKATITTTNGIILSGKSDFIGRATVCIDVPEPEIDATKATKLYEIDAAAHQFSDCWQIQIAKNHIKEVQFIDE